MHLGMPECHKPFLGHCDLDLWPSFQEVLCPEHISYIIWCRNPKFGVVIPLGMAEWCIPFWVTLTLTLTSVLISRFFVRYYSYLSSNVSYARPIPLGAFVTCLWHFLFIYFFRPSDPKSEKRNMRSNCPPLTLRANTVTWWPWPTFHTKRLGSLTYISRSSDWDINLCGKVCFFVKVIALSVKPCIVIHGAVFEHKLLDHDLDLHFILQRQITYLTVRHFVSGIETTRLLFYSILFNSHVPFFCTSVTIFSCYLCPDEGLCKTETRRL